MAFWAISSMESYNTYIPINPEFWLFKPYKAILGTKDLYSKVHSK